MKRRPFPRPLRLSSIWSRSRVLGPKQPSSLPVLWVLGTALRVGGTHIPSAPMALAGERQWRSLETSCPCRKGLCAAPACDPALLHSPQHAAPAWPIHLHRCQGRTGSGSYFSSTVGRAVWFRQQSVLPHDRGKTKQEQLLWRKDHTSATATHTSPLQTHAPGLCLLVGKELQALARYLWQAWIIFSRVVFLL